MSAGMAVLVKFWVWLVVVVVVSGGTTHGYEPVLEVSDGKSGLCVMLVRFDKSISDLFTILQREFKVIDLFL